MDIKRLSRKTAETILSGQVITDVIDILKELLENALDSKAKSIRVSCGENGMDYLEITDDGNGIFKESLMLMCRFGGTSKIYGYEDIEDISGFGFRGEGLAAIRHSSDIEVISRVQSDPKGWKAVYSQDKEEPNISEVDCSVGTRIRVISPFLKDKVKREELQKDAKTYLKRMVEYIQTYALIKPNTKFEFHNYIAGKNNCIFSYLKDSSVIGRIGEIFGFDMASNISLSTAEEDQITIKAYLSNVITSGTFKLTSIVKKCDLRMVVNEKPADFPKGFKSVVDRIYTEYNPNAKYFVLLFISVPNQWVDFNLSKDKREVQIKNKETIKKILNGLVEKHILGIKEMQKVVQTQVFRSQVDQIPSRAIQTQSKISFYSKTQIPERTGNKEETKMDFEKDSVIKEEKDDQTNSPRLNSKPDSIPENHTQSNFEYNPDSKYKRRSGHHHQIHDSSELKSIINPNQKGILTKSQNSDQVQVATPSYMRRVEMQEEAGGKMANSEDRVQSRIDSSNKTGSKDGSIYSETDYKMGKGEKEERDFDSELDGNLMKITRKPKSQQNYIEDDNLLKEKLFADNEVTEDPIKAKLLKRMRASKLQRDQQKFLKSNFAELKVVGQFNKGFIICKWKDGDGRYLVIDQHAADEKSNYEKMVSDLKVNTQMLISPIVVSLTIVEWMVVKEKLEVFEKNGFKLNLVTEEENNKHIVEILGVPNVFFWKYDKKDFMDLLYLVVNHGGYLDELILPKTKREIATKACRSSIMIGSALNNQSMREVVKKMSTLDQPWNCPHGRPSTIIAEGIREPKFPKSSIVERLKTVI